ncbi:UNVERIFIED_CONTAM: hypothetical protein Slati_2692000 [Sesamum latifolium]|uniref:DUF4218 domain-containing protein n=1 Tax=Sesamum latifolium TaxID=2727402 RepID=A0AAW2VZU4_9LAMI
MKELRLHDMKSHDWHVFMQKLILIAFHEMLPEPVWSALTEVSLLFQILCSLTLNVNKVQELEASVATILCNLEKIFPPTFFDSMEHLIVHLPYKAHVGELVQYRWMYSFERFFLNELYEHHHSEVSNIEELVNTQFKDWFKYRVSCALQTVAYEIQMYIVSLIRAIQVKSELNYTDNDIFC